jgi:hypothetical protein
MDASQEWRKGGDIGFRIPEMNSKKSQTIYPPSSVLLDVGYFSLKG